MFRPTEAEVVLPPLGSRQKLIFRPTEAEVGDFIFRPTEAEVVLPPLGGS